MDILIDFCFQGGLNKYICVNKFGAKWRNSYKGYTLWFDKDKLKDAVRFILNNCYFTFGDALFRQIIGIPMGSDPAPFLANLFLYYYESEWLTKIMKTDLERARRFANTFRFIDDLLALNDSGEFEKSYPEIYPKDLLLKKENDGYEKGSYLCLFLSILNRKFEIKLFDKRDTFPFSIFRMPFRQSNIPKQMFYATIGAEILRIARATIDKKHFKISSDPFLKRMIAQGAVAENVSVTLRKLYGRHCND